MGERNSRQGKRKSGIDIIGDVPWGTHLCQFYKTKQDLIDVLVPYFKAGLENNELCLWVTSEPLIAEEAERSLRKGLRNLDKYIRRGQIEIMDFSQWYTKSGIFAADEVLRAWINKENEAVREGYDGLRLAGNTYWLEKKDWRDFADYEVEVNNVFPRYRMLAVCPYSLDKCGASEVIDVVNSHQFALIKRNGKWEIMESSERKKAQEAIEEKEAFNFTLFNYNPIQTIVVDNEGRVVKSNLAKRNSGDRLPNIGDVMYVDYAGKHEIDMRAELMECIRTGKKKDFAELKYGDKFLNVTIAPFPQGAIITSQDITERKRSEEEYRAVVRTAMDGFWVVDTQGRFLDVSGVYIRLIGYSRDELLKMRIQDVEALETPEETAQRIRRIMASGRDRFETQHRCKDGKIIDVEVSVNYLKEAGGRFFVFLRDITQHKKIEEVLRENEEKYRSLVERANDGIVIIQDKLVKYINPRGTEILGYAVQEIVGTPFTNYIHPDEVQRVLSYYTQRIKGKRVPSKYESAVENKEGQKIPTEFNASVISYQGKAADMVIFRDITERKKAEQELKESEEKYRTLTQDVNVSMFRTSPGPKGRFIEVNPEILKMFGYKSKKEFFKLNVSGLHQDPEGRKKFNEKMLRDGFVKNEELRLKKKDGTPIICSVSAVAVKDEKGRVRYFDGIIEDITERKRAEEEIKASQEQMRNLAAYVGSAREEERTKIAREIHDELGQSLTALKMDLSWLYKKIPKDKALLPRRTKSMLGLVDTTIQSVKRISSELRPGLLDDIGVSAAIEWQGEEFQSHTGIRCEVNIEPEDIILDQERSIAIFRIFQEALTNVARHARATRVKASLKKKGGKLELKVRDNGRGITEEEISDPKSFGLMGIKERAHFLNGKVEIKGMPDRGTLITVKIPLPKKGKNDKNLDRG